MSSGLEAVRTGRGCITAENSGCVNCKVLGEAVAFKERLFPLTLGEVLSF